MRFGSISRISSQMLRFSQENFVRIFDDLTKRLEGMFSNINFEDNFKGRTVSLEVQKDISVTISAAKVDFVVLKRFTPTDGQLAVFNWNWRPVNTGIEILFTWSGTFPSATIELFIGEK